MAGDIHNFVLTDEGTLRSVVGPAFYQDVVPNGASPIVTVGDIEGLFHHRLESGRSILLSHHQRGIYEHHGWSGAHPSVWSRIIDGAAPYTTDFGQQFRSVRSADILTQFVGTPAGVVIIPPSDDGYGRAIFYDGDFIGPLGFAAAPGAPMGTGPGIRAAGASILTGTEYQDRGNGSGYYVSMQYPRDGESPEGMLTLPPVFGANRLGTVQPNVTEVNASGSSTNPHGGIMTRGEWRCKAQYQDRWGNLSPLSGPSNGVVSHPEENLSADRDLGDLKRSADRMKVQIKWQLNSEAPADHFVAGTNLYRTRDLGATGDSTYYLLQDYATAGQLATASIPGATAEVYPDNIPDSWLVAPAVDVDAMPEFKVACWSLGRLWIGNVKGDPGRIQPSFAGFPGTLEKGKRLYPDTANEITAMHAIPGGFLAFTRSSTFFVKPDIDGGVVLTSISSRIGCVSPDSIASLLNGAVIWLGVDGFYGWAAGDDAPTPISDDKRRTVQRINPTWAVRACALVDSRSGEYRCWVPVDNATSNNLCMVFDGEVWSTRDDINAEACCTTTDARRYSLASGTSNIEIKPGLAQSMFQGIYVMDHDKDSGYRAATSSRESVIESAWLRVPTSDAKVNVARLLLLLRETQQDSFKVEVFRDWRERPIQTYTAGDARSPLMYPDDDEASYWAQAEVGGSVRRVTLVDIENNPHGSDPVRWDVRRPFWQKVELYVPSCECFKVRMTFTGDAEFVGLKYMEITPTKDIGHNTMPGGNT